MANEIQELATRLRASGLQHGVALAELLEAGSVVARLDPSTIAAGELARTFQLRTRHVEGIQSDHARQLAISTRELAERLRVEPTESRIVVIEAKGKRPLQYNVYETADGRVLGCLSVVSKLEVSEAEWRDLWGQSES